MLYRELFGLNARLSDDEACDPGCLVEFDCRGGRGVGTSDVRERWRRDRRNETPLSRNGNTTMTSQRTPFLRRSLAGIAITAGLLAMSAPAAFGHTEFDLGEVAPVSIVSLHLIVENESRTAGTTQVELRFPEPFVIIELPTVERWTASAVQGSVGAEVIGVLWVRPTASPEEEPEPTLDDRAAT